MDRCSPVGAMRRLPEALRSILPRTPPLAKLLAACRCSRRDRCLPAIWPPVGRRPGGALCDSDAVMPPQPAHGLVQRLGGIARFEAQLGLRLRRVAVPEHLRHLDADAVDGRAAVEALVQVLEEGRAGALPAAGDAHA